MKANETNKAYDIFLEKYSTNFEQAFPLREVQKSSKNKNNKNNSWYTQELSDLHRMKQALYVRHIKDRSNSAFKSEYNKCKNEYFRKVKNTKRIFWQNYLITVKNDVKKTWQVINTALGRKRGKQLFKISINGDEIKNETRIASEFNSYFSSIAEKLVKEIPNSKNRKKFYEYMGKKNPNSIYFNSTSPNEILRILQAFPPKCSSGWDNVP